MPLKMTETNNGSPAVTFRPPATADGPGMHRLAARSGLDINSEYSYLMVSHYFRSTSTVALSDGEVVGFVSGFKVPDSPSELFVWQIAVSPDARGQGIAGRMLTELVARLHPEGVNYVQATINPSNEASIKTFNSLAGRLKCEISHEVVFSAESFSGEGHEEEVLYRIGPFQAHGSPRDTDAAIN